MGGLYRRFFLTLVGLVILSTTTAFSQEITLNSVDGSVKLSGKLLDFDGEIYRIDTQFGEMTINALGVTCAGHSCPDPGQFAADITISGARSVVENLLPGLIEDFGFQAGQTTLRRDHDHLGWTYFVADPARIPVARLQALPVRSPESLADLLSGKVDLAIGASPPDASEKQAARVAGIDDLTSPFNSQVLAIDGLVFIVSPENPISAITLEQAAQIYSGEITNWAELGGFDGPIRPFAHHASSDISQEFSRRVFPGGRDGAPQSLVILNSDLLVSKAVTLDPFAIGYTGFKGVRNAKPLALMGACGMQQMPTPFAINAGDYPLTTAFTIYMSRRRLPIFARNFLLFLDSDTAQTSIADLGFVGQKLYELPLIDQQNRVANAIAQSGDEVTLDDLHGFIQVFSNATRLSSTFRFEDNSTKIDARSRRNIRVLAEMIEVGDLNGRTLIFAAFSDTRGKAEGNRRISRQRAQNIAKMVKSAASRADLSKVNIQTIGMGEVSPLACNSDAAGRKTNRRVEVWVK
jgi:phosphate transport system substrate-binding protein